MEHLRDVFKRFRKFFKEYGNYFDKKDKQILLYSLYLHDFGKLNSHFQKRVKGIVLNEKMKSNFPHNLLSLMFDLKNKIGLENEEDFNLLTYLVAFHHWRINYPDSESLRLFYEDVKKYYEKYLKNNFKNLKLMSIAKWKRRIDKCERKLKTMYNTGINFEEKESRRFIYLLGLLKRFDYTASGNYKIEYEKLDKYKTVYEKILKEKENPWQIHKLNYEKAFDKSHVLIASTGLGKTEYALLWGGKDKLIYTLPVRTSVNAMHIRFGNIFGNDKIGILHSDALIQMLSEPYSEENFEKNLWLWENSRYYSPNLIVSTIDQFFVSVLQFEGFEKTYSLFKYSKFVIDEIQSYSPSTIAIILKGLNDIIKFGGKFLVITATLPKIYKKEFEKMSIPIFFKIPQGGKHFLQLLDNESIEENVSKYIEKLYKIGNKRFLVVLNTVQKAKEIYKILEEKFSKQLPVLLLHSRYTRYDRKIKEKKVLKEYKKSPNILVSTQVVEVSLDINYDVLLTELAPWDVLVQRMGRIKRYEKFLEIEKIKSPNVFIFCKNPSGKGNIYEGKIIELTLKTLKKLKRLQLSERDKQNLMDQIYDENNLKNTRYLKKFKEVCNLITTYSLLSFEEKGKNIAQKIFRGYEMDFFVIPRSLLEQKVKSEFLKYLEITEDITLETFIKKYMIENAAILKEKIKRIYIFEVLKDNIIPIPFYYYYGEKLSKIKLVDYFAMEKRIYRYYGSLLSNIYIVEGVEYDRDRGLSFEMVKGFVL